MVSQESLNTVITAMMYFDFIRWAPFVWNKRRKCFESSRSSLPLLNKLTSAPMWSLLLRSALAWNVNVMLYWIYYLRFVPISSPADVIVIILLLAGVMNAFTMKLTHLSGQHQLTIKHFNSVIQYDRKIRK